MVCECEGCIWHESGGECECTFPSDVPHNHITDGPCAYYDRGHKRREKIIPEVCPRCGSLTRGSVCPDCSGKVTPREDKGKGLGATIRQDKEIKEWVKREGAREIEVYPKGKGYNRSYYVHCPKLPGVPLSLKDSYGTR